MLLLCDPNKNNKKQKKKKMKIDFIDIEIDDGMHVKSRYVN